MGSYNIMCMCYGYALLATTTTMHLQGRASVCATHSIICDALKDHMVARKTRCATEWPTTAKSSFFVDYGVHFGSIFGPSWPRCSQRATQINTNTTEQPTAEKRLTFFETMASIVDPFSTLLGQGLLVGPISIEFLVPLRGGVYVVWTQYLPVRLHVGLLPKSQLWETVLEGIQAHRAYFWASFGCPGSSRAYFVAPVPSLDFGTP